MPESHSTGEAPAILQSTECWHTYSDHGKNSICKAEHSGKEMGKKS